MNKEVGNSCYVFRAKDDKTRLAMAVFLGQGHVLYYTDYDPSVKDLIRILRNGLDKPSEYLMYMTHDKFRDAYEPIEWLGIIE